MTPQELFKLANPYQISKILGITPSSCYKWNVTGQIPPLRLYELKDKKPEWFAK
jgi:hypothetical protein